MASAARPIPYTVISAVSTPHVGLAGLLSEFRFGREVRQRRTEHGRNFGNRNLNQVQRRPHVIHVVLQSGNARLQPGIVRLAPRSLNRCARHGSGYLGARAVTRPILTGKDERNLSVSVRAPATCFRQSFVAERASSFHIPLCFCQTIMMWRSVRFFLPSGIVSDSATQWNRTIAASPTTRIDGSL